MCGRQGCRLQKLRRTTCLLGHCICGVGRLCGQAGEGVARGRPRALAAPGGGRQILAQAALLNGIPPTALHAASLVLRRLLPGLPRTLPACLPAHPPCRSSAPQLQIPGYHEAPAQAALFFAGARPPPQRSLAHAPRLSVNRASCVRWWAGPHWWAGVPPGRGRAQHAAPRSLQPPSFPAGDPTQPAIVPPTDLDLNVGSNIGERPAPPSCPPQPERVVRRAGGHSPEERRPVHQVRTGSRS